MTGCDILDIKCIIMNELIGNVALTIIIFSIFYFIVASRLKFGFDTTILLLFPVIVIVSLATGSFSVIYAFATLAVALMVGWLLSIIIGNR